MWNHCNNYNIKYYHNGKHTVSNMDTSTSTSFDDSHIIAMSRLLAGTIVANVIAKVTATVMVQTQS